MSEKILLPKKQRSTIKKSKIILWKAQGSIKRKARNEYRELSEEQKNIKREYGNNKYKNMSEENKRRLKEYQKNYREAKNST